MLVNPAQPPSVSRCAPRSHSPVSLNRPYLQDPARVQVGTLSFSHPLFGVSVLVIYFIRDHARQP